MNYALSSDFLEQATEAEVRGNTVRLRGGNANGKEYTFETLKDEQGVFYLRDNENPEAAPLPIVIIQDGSSSVRLSVNGYTYSVNALSKRDSFFHQLLKDTATKNSGAAKVVAPMPGLLKSINVKQGQRVKKGERLFILEAMKMENDIKSPIEGVVGTIHAEAGVAVEKSFLLCMIEAVQEN